MHEGQTVVCSMLISFATLTTWYNTGMFLRSGALAQSSFSYDAGTESNEGTGDGRHVILSTFVWLVSRRALN